LISRSRLVTFLLVTLAAWLAAQCVLAYWHGPHVQPFVPEPAQPLPDLLARHWGVAPQVSNELPLTTLAIEYIGGLKAVPVSASVLVVRYQQQQRTLSIGQRLAPGIVLEAINDAGLIFDNNGRRERMPWPPQRPLTGLKRQG
jgi:general secretion pathway protein C